MFKKISKNSLLMFYPLFQFSKLHCSSISNNLILFTEDEFLCLLVQLVNSESKGSWVIPLFVSQNENSVKPLVEFSLFTTLLANHNLLVYPLKILPRPHLNSEMVNYFL